MNNLTSFCYRPAAKQVMEQITSVSVVEDEAYGQVNLVELINTSKTDKGEPKLMYYELVAGTQGDQQGMKRRIDNFKVIFESR